MPNQFPQRSLGELAKVERGRFSARPRNDPRLYNGAFAFIQTGDIARAERDIVSWSQTLNEDGLAVSKLFPSGTLVMSIAANVGDVAFLTFDAAMPDSVVAITPNDQADNNWLFQALRFRKNQLVALATSNAQANLNLEKLVSFKLRIPSVREQRRIAAVLDTWDNAIAAAKRLVALAATRRTWLIDQLAFATVNEVLIGDIASPSSGKAGGDFANFPVFSCTKHDGLVLSDTYFDRTVYGADRTAYKLVPPLTFAYATNHIEEGSIGLNLTGSTGVVSPMYTTFSSCRIDAHYLYAVLKTERMRREFERWTPASVNRRGGLRWDEFSMISVPLPSEETQARVVAAIENARFNVNEYKAQAALLGRQKRGLMQKLLTGEWRVPANGDAFAPGGSVADRLEAAE